MHALFLIARISYLGKQTPKEGRWHTNQGQSRIQTHDPMALPKCRSLLAPSTDVKILKHCMTFLFLKNGEQVHFVRGVFASTSFLPWWLKPPTALFGCSQKHQLLSSSWDTARVYKCLHIDELSQTPSVCYYVYACLRPLASLH